MSHTELSAYFNQKRSNEEQAVVLFGVDIPIVAMIIGYLGVMFVARILIMIVRQFFQSRQDEKARKLYSLCAKEIDKAIEDWVAAVSKKVYPLLKAGKQVDIQKDISDLQTTILQILYKTNVEYKLGFDDKTIMRLSNLLIRDAFVDLVRKVREKEVDDMVKEAKSKTKPKAKAKPKETV